MTVKERTHAVCEGCDQGYSVPDAARTYTCKLCGGTVRVPGEGHGSEGHLHDAIDCSECHAINHSGTEFCVECGSDLSDSPVIPTEEELVQARRKATRDLRRGYKWIDAYRWLCRGGALGYTLVTLTAVLALARTDVPLEAGVLVVALCTLLTILMLMGAVQFLFKPFIWTVVIAIVASSVSVVHFVGPNPLGLAFVWSAFWALAFWLGIPPTLRFRKLIEAHTDLYIEQRASARTKTRIDSGDQSHRHNRLLRVMRNANGKAWRISALIAIGAILLSTVGTSMVVSQVRPGDLNASVEQFEDAWSDSSRKRLTRLFDPAVGEWQVDRLFGLADGLGWGSSLPELGEGHTSKSPGEVQIRYEVGGLPVTMRWSLHDREWYLLQILMPIPSVDPVFEQFLEAWERSNLKDMASFFALEYQERMVISLENTLKNRQWEAFPPVASREVYKVDEENLQVLLRIESGTVVSDWGISPKGVWSLRSLVFPDPVKKRRKRK